MTDERAPERVADEINLHDTTDAAVWASEFCKIWPSALCQAEGKEGVSDGDDWEATMIGWFANAIMAGVDSEARKHEPTAQAPRSRSPAMTDAPEIYRIHKRGRGWYRPNAQGYTANKAEAGLYTLEEARSYTHPNGLDGPRDGLRYELHQTPDNRPTDIIYAWPTYSWLAGSWGVTRYPEEAEKFVRATPETLAADPLVQAIAKKAVESVAQEMDARIAALVREHGSYDWTTNHTELPEWVEQEIEWLEEWTAAIRARKEGE